MEGFSLKFENYVNYGPEKSLLNFGSNPGYRGYRKFTSRLRKGVVLLDV